MPLGERFGLQVDALANSVRGALAGGGAAHPFWRDPAVGLLGVYGSGFRNNAFGGFTRYKAGLEGELYIDGLTLSGVAGWERTGTSGVRNLGTGGGFEFFSVGQENNWFFSAVDLSFYPVDDWRVSVGHRFAGGRHQAAVATEYLFQLGGGTSAAAFIEGRIGGRNNSAVMAGFTVYFGQKDKPLIRRHREDDPPNRLLDDLFAGNRSRALRAAPVLAPPPPPPGGCGPSYL